MANVGYIRVSSVQQNTERQLEDVPLDKTYSEKVSGKNKDREQLQAMIEYVREGDTVHVHSIDRLGRNARDLLNIVHELKEKGVIVHFHNPEIIVSRDEKKHGAGNLLLTILAGVAEMERDSILSRQREGYDAAKAAGKVKGRGNAKNIDRVAIIADLAANKSLRNTAKDNGVSLNTVYRIKKELEQGE